MCGIVGYLGQSVCANWLVSILKKLEYRGYDSSGVAGLNKEGFKLIKKPGQILKLEKSLPKDWEIESGILHTRWATHGAPSEENAHPHLSRDKSWAIVHNGIIENADFLKEKYKLKTIGQTDTEVFTEFLAIKAPENIDEFVKIFDEVQGSYAIICQRTDRKNLFIAKNQSPLYVAEDKSHNILIASDPICFTGFSKSAFMLKDGIFAEISDQSICFYDRKGLKKDIEKINVENCQIVCNESEVESFMLKEIFEQPLALKRQVETYKKNNVLRRLDKNFIKKFDRVMFVACGSAFHAGLIGAKYFESLLNLPSEAVVASEFVYNKRVFDKKTLFVLISQSGETADTLKALQTIKKAGAYSLAITNVAHSSLAQSADLSLDICAGPEIAVASTKAYVCMLSAMYLLAKNVCGEIDQGFKDILDASNKLLDFDFNKVEALANCLKQEKMVVMIGKNFDYVTALEAALKLQEIAYIYTMALPAGELKHGYLALVEEGINIISFAGEKNLLSKMINAGLEAQSRGGVLTMVSPWSGDGIMLPITNQFLMPIVSIVPMQYLAYRVSTLKNLSPDKPRNLAKSVTVE